MNMAGIKLSKRMQSLAKLIDNEIKDISGEKIGFTLIVYTEGRASYLSSIERDDAIREMKKLIQCWEGGMADIKAHEVN